MSSYSPCVVLLIATFSLFCRIPLGLYHWRIPLRVKNTMLSSLVPSLAFPIPWFKNSSGLNIPLCLGKNSADTVSVLHVKVSCGPQTQMCPFPTRHSVSVLPLQKCPQTYKDAAHVHLMWVMGLGTVATENWWNKEFIRAAAHLERVQQWLCYITAQNNKKEM